MRQNARQCFQEHFDIEHSAARLLEVIEATLTKAVHPQPLTC
jgi:hypothetical protein